jgi:hypothetical protein
MPRSQSQLPPWRAGLRSARAHIVPGLILQTLALALVWSYYHSASANAALSQLMEFRRRTGFLFAIASTAVFGGALPFAYLRRFRGEGGRARYGWRQGAALTAFWAYKGFEVDLFYRVLARVIGSGHDPATILKKAMIDQLLYCPLVAVPVMVAVYGWIDAHFHSGPVAADLRMPGWYARRVLPVLISNFGVWAPAVAIIYALPTPLQLPLQNLVLCFYTLLIAHQTAP